jgi:hypothetical protein
MDFAIFPRLITNWNLPQAPDPVKTKNAGTKAGPGGWLWNATSDHCFNRKNRFPAGGVRVMLLVPLAELME